MHATRDDLDACGYTHWSPNLKRLGFATVVIELSKEVVAYLRSDGLVLPLNADGETSPLYRQEDDASENGAFDDEDMDEAAQPEFPELDRQIKSAIAELGGSVFPKLDWSAPRDAKWITLTGTLRCQDLNDIFILLKSSDLISNDLHACYHDCAPLDPYAPQNGTALPFPALVTDRFFAQTYNLVLREYVDMNPAMEFRVFVINGKVVGISQRDPSHYFPYLEAMAVEMQRKIQKFISDKVRREVELYQYVVDVYAGVNGNGMYLIDIAPLCEYTDMLLFTIDEIVLVADEIRVVGSQAAANDYSMNEHENGSNRLPKDSEGLRCVDNGFVVDELVRMVNESR